MISCEKLWEIFEKQGLTYFAGVPDSTFKEWMSFLADNNGKILTNRIAAIERDAVGWAAGYHVSTGKIGVVYMQNSGLGNIVNPITSLTDLEVYNIPLVLMLGWRGEPGIKDEPQHKKMGRITIPLLDILEINHGFLPDNDKATAKFMAEVISVIRKTGKPYAIIVRNGILEEYKKSDNIVSQSVLEMAREEVIEIILDEMEGDEIIVSTTGKTSRELFELREAKKQGHQRDFLMVGSMGLAASFGAEIALQNFRKKVFIFDGDGSLIMSAGALSTIGFYGPENLYHIVFDNASYDSTGGQPTTSPVVNFKQLALANNYKEAEIITTKKELAMAIKEIRMKRGPHMLVVKAKGGARKDLGRPTINPIENKKAFMEFLLK